MWIAEGEWSRARDKVPFRNFILPQQIFNFNLRRLNLHPFRIPHNIRYYRACLLATSQYLSNSDWILALLLCCAVFCVILLSFHYVTQEKEFIFEQIKFWWVKVLIFPNFLKSAYKICSERLFLGKSQVSYLKSLGFRRWSKRYEEWFHMNDIICVIRLIWMRWALPFVQYEPKKDVDIH